MKSRIVYEYFRDNWKKFPLADLRKKALDSGHSEEDVTEALELLNKNFSEEEEVEVKSKKKEEKTILSKFRKKTKVKEIPVLFLRNSGKAQEMFVKPKNGMFEIDGKYYHEKHGSDWEFVGGSKKAKGKIIPEWGLYPMGNSAYLEELKSDAQEFQGDVIRAIQTAETIKSLEEKTKGRINPKIAVLVIISIIVIGYFVFSGGG